MSQTPSIDHHAEDLPDGFSDAPPQEHDEIAADIDARDEDQRQTEEGPGSSGLMPAPNAAVGTGVVVLPVDTDDEPVDPDDDDS